MTSRLSSSRNTFNAIGEIFKNLEGLWNFTREIKSKLTSSPSGIVTGQATFSKTAQNPHQYLYSEKGKFAFEGADGSPLDVSRQYFYEYDQPKDSINVYFATNQSTRDKFFHTLHFIEDQTDDVEGSAAIGCGEHLCEADNYKAIYTFPSRGQNTFEIKFDVKGPQKDYIAATQFKRV